MAGDCETILREKKRFQCQNVQNGHRCKDATGRRGSQEVTLNIGLHSGVLKGLESRALRKRRKRCCCGRSRCLPEYSLLMLGRLAGQELLMGRPCWGIPWFPYMSMRLAGTGIWRHQEQICKKQDSLWPIKVCK